MGLFDGLDMEALLGMLGPSAANAAPAMPDFAERFGAAFPNAGAGVEINPSPTPPGTVPLPRPNPLQPSPEEMASAVRLDQEPTDLVPPGSVGEALTGGGASAPTRGTSETSVAGDEVGGRAKTPGEKRPSLADVLKGVKSPEPPALQKLATPNAPRPTGTIRGGDLQALLMALNAGGAGRMPTLGRG